jgi:hypothetical protein
MHPGFTVFLIDSTGIAPHIESLTRKRAFAYITTSLPQVLRKCIVERGAEGSVNDQEIRVVGHLIKKI